MTDRQLVLDAGVLDRVTTSAEFRGVVRELLHAGWDIVVPTVVLAEALTGNRTDAPANATIARTGTHVTTEHVARRAGQLRSTALRAGGRRHPSGIDAIVAAHALDANKSVIFTTDVQDMRLLLDGHASVRIEAP